MITMFNRASVYIGMDIGKFTRIREALCAENIRYTYKVTNPMKGMERKFSRAESKDMYELFVHKNDFEQAMHVLNRRSE